MALNDIKQAMNSPQSMDAYLEENKTYNIILDIRALVAEASVNNNNIPADVVNVLGKYFKV